MFEQSASSQGPRLIVALDYQDAKSARQMVDRLDPSLCRLKVGNELFTACGPTIVEYFQSKGFEVFLDLKYHDIPNTVASAVKAAAHLGVWMVNIHVSGGREMIRAARNSLDAFSKPPLLIGVSILTSLTDELLRDIGWQQPVTDVVMGLADLAWSEGLDGLVCSAWEVKALANRLEGLSGQRLESAAASSGRKPVFVTPGIRPAGSVSDDQSRIMTPSEAITQGSSFLVVGRPITQAKNPIEILRKINEEIIQCKLS